MSKSDAVNSDLTMAAIRSVMNEPVSLSSLSEHKEKQEVVSGEIQIATEAEVQVEDKGSDPWTPTATQDKHGGISSVTATMHRLLTKARNLQLPFEVKRKHYIWGIVAVLALLRPQWFVIAFFLLLAAFVGTFAIYGADHTWHGIMRLFNRFAARSPERAQKIAARMDAIALRWDKFLDIFPDGTVDGLYLPDFQSLQDAEERHDAAVDERLSRLQAGG